MPSILAVMSRELKYMWRDRVLRNILLIAPVLSLLLFAYLYQMQVVKDVPTVIVDLDNSRSSRDLVEMFVQDETLDIISYPVSYKDMEDLIEAGDTAVGVVIPENYGEDVIAGRQTRILAVIDGSNITYATNASSALMIIARTAGAEAGIKTLAGKGVALDEAMAAFKSIEFKEQSWYNPTLNYAYFLLLALALNIWQQCCTITASVNIIGETGMKSWLQVRASGFSRLKFFAAKSVVQIAVFMLLTIPIYLLAFKVFKLPLECNFTVLFLFTFVFALALHGLGTMMSAVANNAVDSTRFGMMISLPSFILCGYTWPLEAMPHLLQKAVWILPQTWFFQGFNFMVFKGADIYSMSGFFTALLFIALVCYSVSILVTELVER